MTAARLHWENLPGRRLVDDPKIGRGWDALNAGRSKLVFLSSYAIAAALRAFGSGDERLLVGRHGDDCVAMFLLQPVGRMRWQTFQPSQIPLGAWVARADYELLPMVQGLLHGPLPTALVVSVTQVDPLLAPRSPDGATWSSSDYIDTGWVDLHGTFDDYWAQRGKNLRTNMRKQRAKLESEGVTVGWVELVQREEMASAVARYGALEASGWKGREGTAVQADNAQGRFYRQLLEEAASRGEGVVHELRFGDRTVASNLCLVRDGVLVVLKTAYDESVDKSLSPAVLLHEQQLRSFFECGTPRRVEYFGRFREWHSRWTQDKRTLHHLTCYKWAWCKRLRDATAQRSQQSLTEQAESGT